MPKERQQNIIVQAPEDGADVVAAAKRVPLITFPYFIVCRYSIP